MKASGIALALRAAFIVAVSTVVPPAGAQGAPRVAQSVVGAELAELERVRKAVWVDWFAGDTVSLRRALGPELVAIGTGSSNWQSLDQTLASSAKFKAGGGKLVSVTFDSTVTHRFGDAVVMFSHYALVIENGEGPSSHNGRATEVFVRAKGKWVHTSWHLDEVR